MPPTDLCPLSCSNPACRDRSFHPITMLTETCQAPKAEAQTSPGDRVQMSGGSHQGEPAIGAISETLGVIRYVLRVPPVEKIG